MKKSMWISILSVFVIAMSFLACSFQSFAATLTNATNLSALNLNATYKDKAIALKWSTIPDSYYSVYKFEGSESSNPVFGSPVSDILLTSIEYKDSTLIFGKTYFYYVVAISKTGSDITQKSEVVKILVPVPTPTPTPSPTPTPTIKPTATPTAMPTPTATATPTPKATPTPTPDYRATNLTGHVYQASVILNWKPVSNKPEVKGYAIFRKQKPSEVVTSPINNEVYVSRFQDSTVLPEQVYYYFVKPVFAGNKFGDASNEVMVKIPKVSDSVTVDMSLDSKYFVVDGCAVIIQPGTEIKPIIDNGRIIVPVANLVRVLGGTVIWDDKNPGDRKTVLKFKNISLNMNVDKDVHTITITKDGTITSKTIDVGPKLVPIPNGTSSKLYLPIRHVAESFGFTVIPKYRGASLICSKSIVEPNFPPVFDAIPDFSIQEGKKLEFTVFATDVDMDKLTYSVESIFPVGATFKDRKFTWTPGYDQKGIYKFKFVVSDGKELAVDNVTISVGNTNRPPVLSAIGTKIAVAGKKIEFDVLAKDPDGDELTYSAVNLPDGASYNTNTHKFSWVPTDKQNFKTYTVTFEVKDATLRASEKVQIYVDDKENHAPKIVVKKDSKVVTGNPIVFAIKENATLKFEVTLEDLDKNDLFFDIDGMPNSASYAVTNKCGTFDWKAPIGSAGIYMVKVKVSDGKLTTTQNIKIDVSK